MAFSARFVPGHAARHFLALAVMALLVPIGAQGVSYTRPPTSTFLPTGALLGGSLTKGGTFAAGTLTINVANYNGFRGVLFVGTFGNSTIPFTWHYDGKVGKFDPYELIDPISEPWKGGDTVSGQIAQLFFHSKTPDNGGTTSLAGGSSAIATPEPGALGLTGIGLVGTGMMVRRKLQREL